MKRNFPGIWATAIIGGYSRRKLRNFATKKPQRFAATEAVIPNFALGISETGFGDAHNQAVGVGGNIRSNSHLAEAHPVNPT
jgi:hypothetical protein